MNDKSLGTIIVVISSITMILYFIWSFAPFLGPAINRYITPEVSEWAYRIPVVLAVYLVLIIVLWIGYTMATTPPPIPLESPLEIEREDYDSTDSDSKNEV